MFRDDRFYRGIVFSSQVLSSLGDLRQLLPPKSIEEAERPQSLEGGRIEHKYYYSESQFTRNIDLLNEAKKTRGRKTFFRYNLYYISVPTAFGLRVMIAVPFAKMAKELFSHMRDAMRGQKFLFERVLLSRAIEISRDGEGTGNSLHITRLKYNITADSLIESISFVGENIAKSESHSRFIKSAETGISITPQIVRLSLNDQFAMTTDNFGHFQFRVSKNASNLGGFPSMLNALMNLKLTESTSAFPHMKHFDNDEKEEGE